MRYISSKPQEDQSGWMSYVNTATKQLTTYLPSPVTDMFNQGRAFAVCKLPNQGLKNVCAIARYVSYSIFYFSFISKWLITNLLQILLSPIIET